MGIVLLVLKIIGIIILAILALLLFALALVLFVPVRYSVLAEKYGEIKFSGNISWLLRLINIKGKYENNDFDFSVKIFGKKLFGEEEKEETEENQKPKDEPKPIKAQEVVFEEEKKPSAEKTKNIKEKNEPQKVENIKEITEPQKTEIKNETAVKTEKKQEESFEEFKKSHTKAVVRRVKIKETENPPTAEEEKEKRAKKSPEEKEKKQEVPEKINKQYFIKMPFDEKKKIFGCAAKFIKRILKSVFPKYTSLEAVVGTGEPSLTGYVLALAGILKGTCFENINIQADFEKAFFEGKFAAKGKITVGYILYSALCFALAKPIRKIIVLYLKGRGVNNE